MKRPNRILLLSGAIWVLFVVAVLALPDATARFWDSLVALPWILKGPIFLLTLPWAAALWVWQASWAAWVKVLVIATIAFLNMMAFTTSSPDPEAGEPLPDTPPDVMRRGGEQMDLVAAPGSETPEPE